MLWELQSSANNEITQDFFLIVCHPRHVRLGICPCVRGYPYPRIHEGDGSEVMAQAMADAVSCETICITMEVLSLAPQTLPRMPCSCPAEKWETGRHFFKKGSQEHPYELCWIPQTPWKTSSEGCTDAKHFTKISGALVSTVIWASNINCWFSTLLRQCYHGFVLPQIFKAGDEWNCSAGFKNEQNKA